MNNIVFELGQTLIKLKGDKEFISLEDWNLLLLNSRRSSASVKSYISLLKAVKIVGESSIIVDGKKIIGITFDEVKFNKLSRTWDQKRAETFMLEKKLAEKRIREQVNFDEVKFNKLIREQVKREGG